MIGDVSHFIVAKL